MELRRASRPRDCRQEAGTAGVAGLPQHATESGVCDGSLRSCHRQGYSAPLSVSERRPLGRGRESDDRGGLQCVSECGGRLRGAAGRAGQARHGGRLESGRTSVETDLTRFQSPIADNEAAYNQKTITGTDMEEGGRKELTAHWARVCDRLRKEIGDKAFKTWFGEVELGELKAGKLRLYAPTRFVRDWVSRHYGDRVLAYWQAVMPEVTSVEVNLVPPPAPRRPNEIIAMPPVPSPQNSYQPPMPRMGPSIGRGVDEIFQGPEARYTFANFVVGKPNEFAYAAARNIAEQDRPLPERNPLYIFGGVGLGKTHLMHAIWHTIRERDPKQRVIYLTAESFVNRFIQALRTKNTNQFKEMFRNVDVLMDDDVQL